MKKHIITLILTLLTVVAVAQTDYDKGFKNGFKEGYCHNEINCLAPLPPLTPLPLLNESISNYQDGYNRGFKLGLESKNSRKTAQTSIFSNVKSINSVYVSQKLPSNVEFISELSANLKNRYYENKKNFETLFDLIVLIIKSPQSDESIQVWSKLADKLFDITKEGYYEQYGPRLLNLKKEIEINLGNYNKELPQILAKKGETEYIENKYEKAIEYFNISIELSKKVDIRYFLRASTHYHLSQYKEALSDLDTYLLIYDNDPKGFAD